MGLTIDKECASTEEQIRAAANALGDVLLDFEDRYTTRENLRAAVVKILEAAQPREKKKKKASHNLIANELVRTPKGLGRVVHFGSTEEGQEAVSVSLLGTQYVRTFAPSELRYESGAPVVQKRDRKPQEALLIAAGESIRMQTKAGLATPVCKLRGTLCDINGFVYCTLSEGYEFPLTVVEGKAVFAGDTLYDVNRGATCTVSAKYTTCWGSLSWVKPRPKTVRVELPLEQVEYYAVSYRSIPLGEACRKALDKL